MEFNRLPPDMTSAIELYHHLTMFSLEIGNIRNAYHAARLLNCVIPDDYRVKIFKNTTEFEKSIDKEQSKNDGAFYGQEDEIPKAEDQIYELHEPKNLLDQLTYQKRCYDWIYNLFEKVEQQLTKFQEDRVKAMQRKKFKYYE